MQVGTTWSSRPKDLSNSGRIGLSMMRDTRISRSLGRVSRFDEAAGNLSGGVEFFVVLDGEGHEVESLLGLGGAAGGRDDRGAAAGREYGAVGLLGHAPGLEDQFLVADLTG